MGLTQRYLWDTLDSVFSQELHPSKMEVIAIDDGSTDASLAILCSMARKHANMIVRSIENSGSASAPRNAGLGLATGRYVFFLDADDQIESDTLPVAIRLADETGSGIVLCKMGAAGPGERAERLPTRPFVRDRFSEDFIDSKAFTTLSPTKLFRRSLLEDYEIRFPLGYRIGEDQPFTMQAYLVSPHISVMCDKVYYWAYGRGDGTNVTSRPQSPQKHLLKNCDLIEVILESPVIGARRNKLLERPVTGKGGLRATFGKQFSASLGPVEKVEAVERARTLVEPVWSRDLRLSGTTESQVLVDLVVRGDVDALNEASEHLVHNEVLPLVFDETKDEFVYCPQSGDLIRSLNVDVIARLNDVDVTFSGLKVSGEVGVWGATIPPDVVHLVWVHRKSGVEKFVVMDIEQVFHLADGMRSEVGAKVSREILDSRGNWDAFIEPSWGELRLRRRWGKDKLPSVNMSPALVGSPVKAAVVYTRHGNLTVDVGPTGKYSRDTVVETTPHVIGGFVAGRKSILIVEGRVEAIAAARIEHDGQRSKLSAEIHHLTERLMSIVVPIKRGTQEFSIYVTDVDGVETKVGNQHPGSHASQ